MRRSLFFELLRQQLTIALIPILLIGGVAVLILIPRLTDELEKNRQTLAVSLSEQISSRLAASEDHLKLIELDIVNNPNAATLSNRLDGFVQVSGIFETVYLTGADGAIDHIGLAAEQAGSRRLFLDINVSYAEFNAAQLAPGEFYWSNVFISPISGEQSIALVTKLGKAILIAEVDLNQLPAIAESLSSEDLLVMLLDEKATLIAHPDPEISRQQLSLGYTNLFTDQTNHIRTGLFEWQNVEHFASVVPLPKTRWQVVVSQPRTSFKATINYLTAIWLISAGITLLTTMLIAYRTAVKESKPITELLQMTELIASGQYDVKRIETHIHEYQAVSNSFSDMAEQIGHRERELNNLNADLEGRVAQRTSELLSINEALTSSVLRLETTMEQLVESEKLASLGSLVAGIAHELNTPIGNAKIAVSSQQDYIRDLNNDIDNNRLTKTVLDQFINDVDSTSEMSLRNLNRASDLIRSFKQVAVDQTSSNIRTFNLATVINEVLVTLHPTLNKSPVKVETHVPANIDMHSLPGSISQVLTNLINNAVVHGLGDKQETLKIQIAAEVHGAQVVLTVKDTGTGMSPNTIKHAFDPFYTTQLGQGSSGLGLNIVHRMVKGMLKGNIDLQSTQGKGSQFTITMPKDITSSMSTPAMSET